LYGEYKVARLTADYPFSLSPKKVSLPAADTIEGKAVNDRIKGEDWLNLNRRLSERYQQENDFSEAALITGLLADALPNNYSLSYIAGLIYKNANNLPLSLYYLHCALKLEPNNISGNLSIAQNYFLMGQAEKSMLHLKFVKKREPDHPSIDNLIQKVGAKL
jgi:predicted Zn-dependent protease